MSTQKADRIREIKSFPSLVKYLRDDLNWPIETTDFDELTFDYIPEELGIDEKTAAKIQEIKQLRPLVTGQPWGIFFVKFEPKRLPVVVLRKILGQLAIKKRASSRRADQPAWHKNDLLFISNYGEGADRHITFAQFAQPDNSDEIPVLQVLGWDDADTVLHLEHVNKEMREKLSWPKDDTKVDDWRAKWSSAFVLRHMEVVSTSKQLAIRLAELARRIRSRAKQVLAVETERGQLRKLHKAFQEALIHDLTEDDFADMYAQTIAYGLLAARISRPAGIGADNLTDIIPNTNPFLKELLESFLKVGGRKGGLDFDELGVQDVVSLLNSPNTHIEDILRDFGNLNPQEDPVIHFYELFLKEYDAKKRMQRGVFYTPRPVVSYIVRSVDELLRTEFGLEEGLADTTTWGEMLKRSSAITIPEGTSPDQPFVQILDPATGTGTFLVETIDIIHKTLVAKWTKLGHHDETIKALWNEYVPKHLLPRLYGFELLMAPYAIAHLKIGLKLFETGYRFKSDERARVYLTNSLEQPNDVQLQTSMVSALAHESRSVNEVKRNTRFTVVIGNPPYSKLSTNWNAWIDGLLHGRGSEPAASANYYVVDGADLGERTVWIQDDYIKFTRLSQWQIDRTGVGIHSYISNNGYLDNPTLRGMRQQLLTSFQGLWVLDLHGSTKRGEKLPDGGVDKNVFDIQQGVSIGIFMKGWRNTHPWLFHSELQGDRETKYASLESGNVLQTEWAAVEARTPFYLFIPSDASSNDEFDTFTKITEIFSEHHSGIITKRDSLTIHWTADEAFQTVSDFVRLSPEVARKKYRLPADVRDWKVQWAQNDLRQTGIFKVRVIPILYRPFDVRFTYFTGHSRGFVGWPVAEMTRLMMSGRNTAIVTTRLTKGENFTHVLVSKHMAEVICLSAKTSNNGFVFPLYVGIANEQVSLFAKQNSADSGDVLSSNLRSAFCSRISDTLGFQWSHKGKGDLSTTVGPEDVFAYVVAILNCPAYQAKYREFLSRDFPRIPVTKSASLFASLSRLGSNLIAIHLLESKDTGCTTAVYVGSKNPEVERVGWCEDTVWLNKAAVKKGQLAQAGTNGFRGVPEAVWNFHIGGYQVCEKWLKDRKGRKLTKDDIEHYQKIIVALSETIRIMAEIDKVIDQHGGWPGAFQSKTTGE